MTLHLSKTRIVVLVAAALASNAALAANPVGNAAAWDLSVHVSLIGLSQLNLDAQTSAMLTNVTSSANDAEQLPSLSASDPLHLINLGTGLLSSEAEYVGAGMSAIAAKSSVDALSLSAGVGPTSVLAITANNVTSQTALAGNCPQALPTTDSLLNDFMFSTGFDFGNLHGNGGGGGGGGGDIGGLPHDGSPLTDPAISILGIEVPGLPSLPAPNTTIDLGNLGIAGATLILNEQTHTGDGLHSLASTSNGIHLTLNVAALATAEVIVAHSEVSLACP